ncbi:MAG: AraC family ligand binding domain-containing protein, partial [Lachnospiraceae bacterium]|nr:AraC family ligand binding domain-containing protein [Lachnospiraceae bacterium]
MRYFYNQTSNPLNYITCGNLISQDGFVHLRRNFNVNVLILVQEGVLYISQNGVHHCIGPNEYLLLRAGEEHFGYQPSKGRVSYLWVHFTMIESDLRIVDDSDLDSLITVMLNIPANHQYLLPECGNIALTKRAPLLFRQLMDLSHQDMLYSPLILDYALSLLIMELTQELIEMHFHIKNNVPPVIAQIMEWIKINYYRQITVSDVAFEFGYNPDYLSSLFHKTIDMTL